MAAVVAACRCMVEHSDLHAGLQAAVEQLGKLSGHDRAYVWELVDEQQVCVCVAEWDAPGVARLSAMADMLRFRVADFEEVWQPLLVGQSYQSITPLKTGANAALNEAVGNRSDVMVPVILGDTCWGCIGFDNCREERRYGDAEIQALCGAAAAVAAAVQRSRAESQRLALAEAHTAQAEALNLLTQGVVRATRDLLDGDNFESGVASWLAHLGDATQADAALLMELGGGEAAPAADSVALTRLAWRRDGEPFPSTPVPSTRDFDDWVVRLLAHEAVWVSIDELKDPASVKFWIDTDCACNQLMPVVVDGTVRYVLCFDWRERRDYSAAAEAVLRTAADSFTAVLQRQRAADGLLAEREGRLAAERSRADEAAEMAQRIERHARLLEVVARSAEILLAAPTPETGVDAVLDLIGPVVGALRVCVARLEWTPDDPVLHGWLTVSHEWAQPGAGRQMGSTMQRYPMLRSDANWAACFAKLKTQGWVRQCTKELLEPYRSEVQALGVAWSLRYPLWVDGELAALLGFECSGACAQFETATVDALQTVGSAIASALWRHRLQQLGLASERSRADENARLASLLTQVVASSRMLIDADAAGFETAMLSWLGTMGRQTQAGRATFYDRVSSGSAGRDTLRMLCEWVRDGVAGSLPCSFAQPFVIDPDGAEELMDKLTSGHVTTIHTDQTRGPMRAFMEAQGNATVVAVPVFVGGLPWGAVSFDYAIRCEMGGADTAVLRTAADTLSAVLRRNETAAALLAEREARLLAEQHRSSELARANDVLRQALDALAGNDGEAAFLRDVLVQLQQQTGALAAYLFRNDDEDGRLRLVGRVSAGLFSHLPTADDPPLFSRGFEMVPDLLATLVARGRLLWRRVDLSASADEKTPESMRWHLQMGHRANAVHALMIGERQVGFVGMVFDHDEPLSDVQGALANALCQPMTLALELARLSRLAQRGGEQAAMLKERNRLAREIHDGIAQSFLAIQMQLDLLGSRDAVPPPVQKALTLARHGLNEARRAVAALRPQGLQDSDLPSAIQRLLTQIDSRGDLTSTFVSPPAWQALPAEVEDHLFRIVQEAVNNALRHAQAKHVKVELSQAAGEATVLVADDGVGFDVERAISHQGFGLESMQQRAQLIGARIDWLARPAQGTQVLLSWTPPSAAAGSTRHGARLND